MSVKVDDKLVLHIAKLARLSIPQDEVKSYGEHLTKILTHVELLSAVPTEGVLSLSNPMKDILLNSSASKDWGREDMVKPSLSSELILQNAPDQQLNQFKVEAVIEE